MFKHCWVWGWALSAMLIAQGAMAFPCFVTISKDTCWTNYVVTLDVVDAETNTILTTIVIPKGEPWSRGRFDAKKNHHLMIKAKFKPAFWKSEVGKVYNSERYWILPDVKNETVALHVSACFPDNFSEVPFPPDGGSNCACPKKAIPHAKDLN